MVVLNDLKKLGGMHRVLVMTDDAADRIYPFWASKMIESKEDPQAHANSLSPSLLVQTIAAISTNLLKIGTTLKSLSKHEAKRAFEELSDRFRREVISASLVALICECDDIISVDEWIKVFTGDISFSLESELVWPAASAKPIEA